MIEGRPGGGGGGSGIPVYLKKIRQNTQNSSKYTQNYTQVYFIPEIQRKWYTEYPYLSCNIPYTRFKKPLYTVYPKTLADPDESLKSRTLKTFHGTSVCEKENIYSVTYFPYMCCVTGINLWGKSSVLLNCRFYGPVRGYTHTWKSTSGLFSHYWMGKAVSVNARLSETFF